jgi:hypothetical protein
MKFKQLLFLLIFGVSTSAFGQIDIGIGFLVQPSNDTLDFSAEYTDGCFSPEIHMFTFGSGSVLSDEVIMCWEVNNGAPVCYPFSIVSFPIMWGTNLQSTYPDTICMNPCGSVDVTFYVSHPNDPNQSNDTLRITFQDDCGALNASNLDQELMNIFPNPAINELTVELNQSADVLNVLSIDGRVKQTIDRPENTVNINVDSYDPGVYLIEVISDDKRHISRFVKE